MEYKKNNITDTGERYIIENGKVVKRYFAGQDGYIVYLRKQRVLNVADTPKAYNSWQVYTSKEEAEKRLI